MSALASLPGFPSGLNPDGFSCCFFCAELAGCFSAAVAFTSAFVFTSAFGFALRAAPSESAMEELKAMALLTLAISFSAVATILSSSS